MIPISQKPPFVDIYISLAYHLKGYGSPYKRIARWLPNEGATFVDEDLFRGFFGHLRYFVLYQDSKFLLLYFCQPVLFVFHEGNVILFSRDQKLYDQTAFYKMEQVLRNNHIRLPLTDVDQVRCWLLLYFPVVW